MAQHTCTTQRWPTISPKSRIVRCHKMCCICDGNAETNMSTCMRLTLLVSCVCIPYSRCRIEIVSCTDRSRPSDSDINLHCAVRMRESSHAVSHGGQFTCHDCVRSTHDISIHFHLTMGPTTLFNLLAGSKLLRASFRQLPKHPLTTATTSKSLTSRPHAWPWARKDRYYAVSETLAVSLSNLRSESFTPVYCTQLQNYDQFAECDLAGTLHCTLELQCLILECL